MHHNNDIVHRLPNEGRSTVVCDSELASHMPSTRFAVPITATSECPVSSANRRHRSRLLFRPLNTNRATSATASSESVGRYASAD